MLFFKMRTQVGLDEEKPFWQAPQA